MDVFAPDTVFSSIDHQGRYAYANQPFIAQWNLARLAESLLPLIHNNTEEAIDMAEDILNSFEPIYKTKWLNMMGSKLGISQICEVDKKLITNLLDWMHENGADFTNTFRDLSQEKIPDEELYATESFQTWHARWQARLGEEDLESSLALRKSVNPAVIPRNHKVEEALQACEEGGLEPFRNLLKGLEKPYEDGEHLAPYQIPPKPEEKVTETFCGT
jgi:uncharacterized protein YdiU (UPF0061 family)